MRIVALFLFLGSESEIRAQLFRNGIASQGDLSSEVFVLSYSRKAKTSGQLAAVGDLGPYVRERHWILNYGQSIELKIPQGDGLRLFVIGSTAEIAGFNRDEHLTFRIVDTPVSGPAGNEIPDAVDVVRDGQTVKISISKPAPRITDLPGDVAVEQIMVPVLDVQSIKGATPREEILIDGALYYGPSRFGWVSNVYTDAMALSAISAKLAAIRDMDDKAPGIEDLYRLWASAGSGRDIQGIREEYREMAANSAMLSVIAAVEAHKEGALDVAINDQTKEYVSFTYRMLLNRSIRFKRSAYEDIMGSYEAVFLRPFYRFEDFLRAMEAVSKCPKSVFFVHILNSGYILRAFGRKDLLPVYSADCITARIVAVRDRGARQSYLEMKATLFSEYNRNVMLRLFDKARPD